MTQIPHESERAIIRSQVDILSIAEGFLDSSVLFALVKLRIFELIDEGRRDLEEIAAALDAPRDALARLLNAGVALKLLESRDGTSYRPAPAARAVLLPSAGENYLGNWIRNLDYLRSALSRLDEAVLESRPTVDPSTHLGSDKQRTREFALAMHNYASLRGKELARSLDTSECKTLLDLGSGPGTYAFHLGMANPRLCLYLLDLPEVLETTKEIQSRYSLENEVHYLPLDVLRDEMPGSYDMILISNTLHMLGEDASIQLLKRLYAAVNPGGSLVIQAQYLSDDRLGGRWPTLLDLIQLCITSRGRNHSVEETRYWLEEAGFEDVEFCPMAIHNANSFLRGYRSS